MTSDPFIAWGLAVIAAMLVAIVVVGWWVIRPRP